MSSSRDDSILYSGVTSASSKPITPRQAQVEKREQDYAKLKPAAAVVLELLAKEKAAVLDLRTFVIARTSTEQEVNTELLARKLYLDKLNALETTVKNTLKFQPRKKKEPTDE